jgi:uncharacterized protein YjbJ (UPF0337 family)
MANARSGNAADMTERSGPEDAARGTAEGVKGTLKQWWAKLTGNRRMAREAGAQQEKGAAQRDAAAHEAEADKARAEAAAREAQQRSQQDI